MFDDTASKRRLLHNTIATMINTLHQVQNQKGVTWDDKIKGMIAVAKCIPETIRLMWYFKNKETSNGK